MACSGGWLTGCVPPSRDRNFARATELYRRALELNPRAVGAQAGLAFTKQMSGELDQAIEHYHLALADNPSDSFAIQMLHDCLHGAAHDRV